jgi:hypothetical protein
MTPTHLARPMLLRREALGGAPRRCLDLAGNIKQHLILFMRSETGQRPADIVRCLKAVEIDRVGSRR